MWVPYIRYENPGADKLRCVLCTAGFLVFGPKVFLIGLFGRNSMEEVGGGEAIKWLDEEQHVIHQWFEWFDVQMRELDP